MICYQIFSVGQPLDVIAALNQQYQNPAWSEAWNEQQWSPQAAAWNQHMQAAARNPQFQAAAWGPQGAAWNPELQAAALNSQQQGAALNSQQLGAAWNQPQLGAALYPEQLVGTRDASLDALLGTASPPSGKTSVPNKPAGGTTIPNKAAPPPPPALPNKAPDTPPVHPKIPFLLDPSPFDLPHEECITSDGEVGECHSPLDCGYTNGVINGLCHQGMDISAHARKPCQLIFSDFGSSQ